MLVAYLGQLWGRAGIRGDGVSVVDMFTVSIFVNWLQLVYIP